MPRIIRSPVSRRVLPGALLAVLAFLAVANDAPEVSAQMRTGARGKIHSRPGYPTFTSSASAGGGGKSQSNVSRSFCVRNGAGLSSAGVLRTSNGYWSNGQYFEYSGYLPPLSYIPMNGSDSTNGSADTTNQSLDPSGGGGLTTPPTNYATLEVPTPSGNSVAIDVIGGNRGVTPGVRRAVPAPLNDSLATRGPSYPGGSGNAPQDLQQAPMADLVDRLRDPRAQATVVRVMKGRGVDGRGALAEAARSSVEPQVRAAALAALDRPSDDELDLLADAISHQHSLVRRAAIRAAGDAGPAARSRAQSALLKALEAEDAPTRDVASTALANLAAPPEPLVALLESTSSESVREAASRTLIGLGEPAANPLAKLLDDARPQVRYWAAFSLGELGRHGEPALSRLEALAKNDPDATVKFYADAAVRKLTR